MPLKSALFHAVLLNACLIGVTLLSSNLASAASLLAVATFDQDRPEMAGTTITRTLRVSNLSDEQVTLRLAPRGIQLLDDGATRIQDQEDPRWQGRVTIAEPSLALPGKTSKDVELRISIPADLPADDYILGVVVSPLVSGQGVLAVNEIGALLPISLQGDRLRSLEIIGHQLPSLVIGDRVDGAVRVRNTGATFASAWTEVNVENAVFGNQVGNIQLRERTRVAPGLTREFAYSWEPGITAGKFRLPVRVSYKKDEATITELNVYQEVWLIHPSILVGLAVLFAVGMVFAIRRGKGYGTTPGLVLAPQGNIA